jgi:heme a synthase
VRSITPATYRRITALAAFALVVIIVTGAGVRLSGSGLGCSDWPKCEQDQLHAEWSFHPMVEFVNRVFTGVVSIAVILAVLGSLVRSPRRRDLTLLSLGLVVGVIVQILIGALVVKSSLLPNTVALHYMASIVLVVNAVVLHRRAATDEPLARCVPTLLLRAIQSLGAWSVVVLIVGTVVVGAGPHAGDERAKRLGFDLTAVTRLHSLSAWVLVAGALGVYWLAARRYRADPEVVDRLQQLLWALGLQGFIGYVQYAAKLPAGIVAVHVLGSVIAVIAAVRVLMACYQAGDANVVYSSNHTVVANLSR